MNETLDYCTVFAYLFILYQVVDDSFCLSMVLLQIADKFMVKLVLVLDSFVFRIIYIESGVGSANIIICYTKYGSCYQSHINITCFQVMK